MAACWLLSFTSRLQIYLALMDATDAHCTRPFHPLYGVGNLLRHMTAGEITCVTALSSSE